MINLEEYIGNLQKLIDDDPDMAKCIDNLRVPAIAFLAVHDAEGDVIAADCNIKGEIISL